MKSIAVVGIGNSLLKDDGVGVHVLEHFVSDNPFMDVICLDAGTIGLALMDRLSHLDGLIAIDAMRLNKKTGTVTVLQGTDMDSHLQKHNGSVHELGLCDLMDALRLCGDLPPKRALVGIEPGDIDWGTKPSRPVAAAVPLASMRVRELICNWRERAAREEAA